MLGPQQEVHVHTGQGGQESAFVAEVGGVHMAFEAWLRMQPGWAASVWPGRILMEVRVGAGNIRQCLWAP
jgi:hypothetical protein